MLVTPENKAQFLARVSKDENGCWSWAGHHDADGYSRFTVRTAKQLTIAAHRFAYALFAGDVPEDMQIDHLCRNRSCVNPEHLEVVTAEENLRRSDVALGIRSAATHCVSGHEFTSENTYIRVSGRRACRACKRAYDRRIYQQRTQAPAMAGA